MNRTHSLRPQADPRLLAAAPFREEGRPVRSRAGLPSPGSARWGVIPAFLGLASLLAACGAPSQTGDVRNSDGVPTGNASAGEVRDWTREKLGGEPLLEVHLSSNRPADPIPAIRRESRDQLVLQFETPGQRGRFFSIRFRPADRNWQVSDATEEGVLPPPDEITEYDLSTDLDFPYVQYRYVFPNSRVEFYRSGNFILEVVDDRGRTLLDRRFFVTDDLVEVDIDARSTSFITDSPDELLPEASVELPNDPWFSPDDCQVCFLKNGWMDETLCTDISRVEGSSYVFEARRAFRPTVPVFAVDLRGSSGIRRRDDVTVPVTVSLFADDIRFWGDDFQYASPVPRPVDTGLDATTRYVNVQFSIKGGGPDDTPRLVGTFNDWTTEGAPALEWNPEAGAHEMDLPLKEERLFYTYSWNDPSVIPAQSKFEGPDEVVFTAVVYAKDSRYPTERILAIASQSLPE